MVKELISVVMPVCDDKEEYLKESLQSVLLQQSVEFELVIVDSSENPSVWENIDLTDKRIKYYWIPRNGIANALNFGLSKASGNYIARMDADDVMCEYRLFEQYSFLKKNLDIDIVGSDAYRIDGNGNIIGVSNVPKEYEEIRAQLLFSNVIYHPTVMFRKSIIEDEEFYDPLYYSEDYDLWTRLVLDHKIVNMDLKLIKYRVHSANASKRQLQKVMSSTSKSAWNYVERLFNLNVDKYQIYDMCHYRSQIDEQEEYADFVIRQMELMNEIWVRNCVLGNVEEELLRNVIQKRWEWCIGRYAFVDIRKMMCMSGKSRSAFLPAVDRKNIEQLEMERKEWLGDAKKFLIYGLGARGKLFISEWVTQVKQGFNWELVGICDQQQQMVEIQGKLMETISIGKLKDIQYDYVIVTPNRFDEIKKSLIENGVQEETIISSRLFV